MIASINNPREATIAPIAERWQSTNRSHWPSFALCESISCCWLWNGNLIRAAGRSAAASSYQTLCLRSFLHFPQPRAAAYVELAACSRIRESSKTCWKQRRMGCLSYNCRLKTLIHSIMTVEANCFIYAAGSVFVQQTRIPRDKNTPRGRN